MKYTRFQDIPQFTPWGEYSVNVFWTYLEKQLAEFDHGYGLELDPDFQRGHVWSKAQQVAYVEYVLRGGRAARTILFNCVGWSRGSNPGPLQLVDGKQRLQAARRFMGGEIRAFGSLRSGYTDNMRMGGGGDFLVYVNDLPTRADVLRWYLDLNTGGVVHTDDEIAKVRKLLAAEKGATP